MPTFRGLPIACSGVAFLFVALSPVSYTGGDTYGALLVSQSLAQRHTVKLDDVADYFAEPGGGLRHSVAQIKGHLHFRYPLGVPIISIPVVATANLFGVDVRDGERVLQKLLSAVVAAFVVALLFFIGRIYLNERVAALLALLGFSGTVIAPTVGGALWSIDYALVFLGLTVLLLLRAGRNLSKSAAGWLGITLFFGYLSRPTFALFIICVFAYLWLSNKTATVWCATTSGILFLIYSAWHLAEYGHLLPPVYADTHLDLSQLRASIPGLLFSPSRNLLIGNPFLVIFPILAWQAWRRRVFTPVMGLLSGSAVLMALGQVLYPNWWGGWSYGPRIATEMVFVLLVFSIIAYGALRAVTSIHPWLHAAAVVALAAGTVVNLPGLYNPYTLHWNAYPDVDQHPTSIVFDWRFPQFRTNRDLLVRKYEVQSRELGLTPDRFIAYQRTIRVPFARAPVERRVTFRVTPQQRGLYARVVGVGPGVASLAVYLNGWLIGEYATGSMTSTHPIDLPDLRLRYDRDNALRLEFRPRVPVMNGFFGALSIRQY